MGYFSNGFVFSSKPDFDVVSKTVPGRSARGYKHNQLPIWLLDLWKPRGKLQLRRAPFCDPAVDGFRTDLATVDAATRRFLTAFEQLKQALGYRNTGPEDAYVHLALAIAGAARIPTFFFAADDEDLDMGCNTVPGSLVSFGCRLYRLSVQYSAEQTTITPLNFLGDGDDEGIQELIAKVRSIAGISISEPRDIEDGQVLYENPVALWPKAAGDPAEILGLGTWDPLQNIENDFTVVFEHLNQA